MESGYLCIQDLPNREGGGPEREPITEVWGEPPWPEPGAPSGVQGQSPCCG